MPSLFIYRARRWKPRRKKEGAGFAPKATKDVYRSPSGYPCFSQEWGSQLWNRVRIPHVSLKDVEETMPCVQKRLDESFYRALHDRLTDREKRFMSAMAECGERCKSPAIAKTLGIQPSSLSPTGADLIRKAMTCSPQHKSLDYCTPQFAEFYEPPERKRLKPLFDHFF